MARWSIICILGEDVVERKGNVEARSCVEVRVVFFVTENPWTYAVCQPVAEPVTLKIMLSQIRSGGFH